MKRPDVRYIYVFIYIYNKTKSFLEEMKCDVWMDD